MFEPDVKQEKTKNENGAAPNPYNHRMTLGDKLSKFPWHENESFFPSSLLLEWLGKLKSLATGFDVCLSFLSTFLFFSLLCSHQ